MGILKCDPKQGEKKVLPKKPKNNQSDHVTSDFSDELFSNYTLTPDWEEALWSATNPEQRIEDKSGAGVLNTPEHPMHDMSEEANTTQEQVMIPEHAMSDVAEPMMVEEDVWNINVDVSNEGIVPPEASLIAENNQYENNLDDCWGFNTFHDQSSSMVDTLENIDYGIYGNFSDADKATEVESIYNMDLVQFAIGESGLDGLLVPKEEKDTNLVETGNTFIPMFNDQPVATTSSFLHTTNNFIIAAPTTFPETLPKKVEGNLRKIAGGKVLKKRPGRPERKTPIQITEIPKKGSVGLTEDKLKAAKYRRARDLNNEASKRCRQNRKEKQLTKERECQELAKRNEELKEKVQQMETALEALKVDCRAIGYPC